MGNRVKERTSERVCLYQGWPTSQMLRAFLFFLYFSEKSILHARDNDRINITIPLIGTQYFCSARFVVYRPVSSIGNDLLSVRAGGQGFVARAGPRRHSVAIAAMVLQTSKQCCAGAKPRRWARHSLHARRNSLNKVIIM